MPKQIHLCAEIGSNHCGSLDLALAHITAAREAGADSVKFQLFRANSLDSRPEMREQLRPYELPLTWLPTLQSEAHALGLQFGVTPFAVDLVEPLRHFVDFVKISAYDLTYRDLVSAAARLNVPVVLSTAMATYPEIDLAVGVVRPVAPLTLLHGVAAYPARLEDMNLLILPHLASGVFGWLDVGLSDHTIGEEAAVLATALGATWIEKHFVIDVPETCTSPDYPHSATPQRFMAMKHAIRRTIAAGGKQQKTGPLPCEQELYNTARRTNIKPLRG